jgi:hypothetical protein
VFLHNYHYKGGVEEGTKTPRSKPIPTAGHRCSGERPEQHPAKCPAFAYKYCAPGTLQFSGVTLPVDLNLQRADSILR